MPTTPSNNILQTLALEAYNPMQLQAFEAIANKEHIQLLAPTGSGKTLAFLVPIYLQLLDNTATKPNALIVAPTRELALQIQQVWRSMHTGFKSVACYGGHKIDTEINELIETPSIIIGTPGRLVDHIVRQSFDAKNITTIVIDEFDKTLELGFQDQLADVVEALPNLVKKVLVSATQLDELPAFMQFTNPTIVNALSTEDNLQTQIYWLRSPDKDKMDTLEKLLKCEIKGTSIIFVNHRDAAERIYDHLNYNKINAAYYHGGLEQLDREIAIIKFKNHTVDILIASDIAARGIDIDAIAKKVIYTAMVEQLDNRQQVMYLC
jgi:ATP-dependent RNA helicase DeaD